jgi:hypothetical protein
VSYLNITCRTVIGQTIAIIIYAIANTFECVWVNQRVLIITILPTTSGGCIPILVVVHAINAITVHVDLITNEVDGSGMYKCVFIIAIPILFGIAIAVSI